MGKIKRYKNIVEKFLSGESGQRFFNFAYSIGAAVVIWGAHFKILHLPGGNTLLCIGMGTEVFMFILSAFDRPGRDYHWEEVFPVLATKRPEDRPDFNGGQGGGLVINGQLPGADSMQGVSGGTLTIAAGGASGNDGVIAPAMDAEEAKSLAETTKDYMEQMTAITEQLHTLRDTTEALNEVSSVLLQSYKAVTENSENITRSSEGYVAQMQDLNRNITGLNTIFEIQLKSVSSQLDAIDRVNRGIKDIRDMYEKSARQSTQYCEETEKMANNMKQLNHVYEKMLHAMTVNMYGGPMTPPPSAPTSSGSGYGDSAE